MKWALAILVCAAPCRIALGSSDISFSLTHPGFVSLAIYDSKHVMVREVLRGAKLEPGAHVYSWDGLDRYGRAVPSGDYEWRLLQTPGFTREFLLNLGTNPGWSPAGEWPGNHTGPTSVFVDGETNVYIGAVSSEGAPHLLKMSLDGRKKFWSATLHDGFIGITRCGEQLVLLFSHGGVQLLSAETGSFGSIRGGRRTAGGAAPAVNLASSPFQFDVIHPDDPSRASRPEERKHAFSMSLAGAADSFAVTYKEANEVRLFRLSNGVIVATNVIHVPEPHACCISTDGTIFVISSRSILAFSRDLTPASPRTLATLESPKRISYDAAHGEILVAERGPGADCIVRCSAADGAVIARYGRHEGRRFGHFNPLDFSSLLDIAADPSGGFFTVEETPRRVAHFRCDGNEQSISLLDQWFGGTQWGAMAAIDPADPTVAYVFLDHVHCGRAKINYAAKTWTLTDFYDTPEGFTWTTGKDRHRGMFPGFSGLSFWQVRHEQGETFLLNNGRVQGGCVALVRVDDEQGRIVPVAILSALHPSLDRDNPPSWWKAAMKRAGFDAKSAGFDHFSFAWSDANSNGQVDPDEISLGTHIGPATEAHAFVDKAWNLYMPIAGRFAREATEPLPVLRRISNEGSATVPRWSWDQAKTLPARYSDLEMTRGAASPAGLFCDDSGETYLACNAYVDPKAQDIPPSSWPNNTTAASRLHKWNAAGKLEWSVGLHTASKNRPAGEFAQARGIIGKVRGCVVAVDACEPASVWTSDGLYVGSLCGPPTSKDRGAEGYDQLLLDDNHWGEVLETSADVLPFISHTSEDKTMVLWAGMAPNTTPIYRIGGWSGWQRMSGKLPLQDRSIAAKWAGKGLRAEYFANADLAGQAAIKRIDKSLWFGPMWGDHREIPTHLPFPSLHQESRTQRVSADGFSARWTGFFEPPLSETFTFVVYTYGFAHGGTTAGDKVRLWIDNQLVLDQWDNIRFEKVSGWWRTRGCEGKSVVLSAGHRVPIRLELADLGGSESHLHLFYRSTSIDERHVPQELLYPE